MNHSPIARIERLLDAGDAAGALRLADEFLRRSPTSFLGRLARARANLRLGNHVDAETDMELALAISPRDEHARLIRANMDFRLGRNERAIEALEPIARGQGPHAVEATLNLMMVLFESGHDERLQAECAIPGAWREDPRATLMQARATARRDPEAGIEALRTVFRTSGHGVLRRLGGLEAAGLLDRMGRYREAFALATEVHRATSAPLDLEEWLAPLLHQSALLGQDPGRFRPRTDPVQGVAFVVALPRSGTTLLEHMLDRHPAIGGIGEFDGLDFICRTLFGEGGWPDSAGSVPEATIQRLQRHYLSGAERIRRDGASWTVDKSLRAWRALPEISAVLPGSACICVDRDPRDVATSLFLSYFDAASYAWTQSLEAIRRVIETRHRLVPLAVRALGLRSVRIPYEDLVERPSLHASRCLGLLGLPMDDRVLSPEDNPRGAFTLSFAQVRQPINRRSVGRWRNYEWAFGREWDAIVSVQQARDAD